MESLCAEVVQLRSGLAYTERSVDGLVRKVSGPPAEPASSRLIPVGQGLSLLIRGNGLCPCLPIPPVCACSCAICDQYVISAGDKGYASNLLVNPLWWESLRYRGSGGG
jgi:hypothetical protein